MKQKRIFSVCISLLMGVSICMSNTAMVFATEEEKIAAETDVTESKDESIVDLTAFCTDGEYRYKGIPWRASKEEAEEILGVSLELEIDMGIGLANYRSPIEFQGEPGFVEVGLTKDVVTFVLFCFGAEEDKVDEFDGDLTELWEYVQEQFTEQYGEPDRITEKEGLKSCQWQEKKDGYVNTVLNLQGRCDEENGQMYYVSFGSAGIRDMEELKEELGILPVEQEEEISAEAGVAAETETAE